MLSSMWKWPLRLGRPPLAVPAVCWHVGSRGQRQEAPHVELIGTVETNRGDHPMSKQAVNEFLALLQRTYPAFRAHIPLRIGTRQELA